jgi:hypothetical protein
MSYDDLLDEANSEELTPIVAALDNVCNTSYVPDNVNWHNLRMLHVKQIMQQPAVLKPSFTAVAQPWWRPLTRKAVVIPVIALLFFAASAFTFAATPLLQNVLLGNNTDPVNPIKYSTLGDLSLSQKIGKVTITLQKGYIDNNQLVFGVVASPADEGTSLTNDALTTQSGTVLSGSGDSIGEKSGQTLAQSFFYDNNGIAGNPSSLNLTLKMNLVENGKTTNTTLGTATFNFTLPYHQGEVVTPNLSATSQGKTLTLAKVSISKVETQIYFTGGPLYTKQDRLKDEASKQSHYPQSDLQVAGSSAHSFNFDSTSGTADGTFIFQYSHDFSQSHGPWTITITQGTYKWVFHFDA